jgi:hypothetical protein
MDQSSFGQRNTPSDPEHLVAAATFHGQMRGLTLQIFRDSEAPHANSTPSLFSNCAAAPDQHCQSACDCHLVVPEGPGLGLQVDEEKLQIMTANAQWTFGVDLAGVLDCTAANRPSARQGA